MNNYLIKYTTNDNQYPLSRPAELEIKTNSMKKALFIAITELNNLKIGYTIILIKKIGE